MSAENSALHTFFIYVMDGVTMQSLCNISPSSPICGGKNSQSTIYSEIVHRGKTFDECEMVFNGA